MVLYLQFLSITGIRARLFSAIPDCVRKAIPAGIGLFIAFLGLQNAGIVVNDPSTCVNLASFNVLNGNATWATIMPRLVTIAAVIIIAVMTYKKVKGSDSLGNSWRTDFILCSWYHSSGIL